MTFEIGLVLALLILAVVLFALEWLSVDVVTLLLLVTLVLAGTLSTEEAFSGFGNEIIVVLASIFVLSGALSKTGVMDWLGHLVFRLGGHSERSALVVVMAVSAAISAFINNTTTTALLIPVVVGLCRKMGLSPGRLLMPMAFASMLGGTCTLIGTSTNVAASGFIQEMGLPAISIFEFFAPGLIVVVSGIAFTALVGYRMLPRREEGSLAAEYDLQEYLSELVVARGSTVVGKTLQNTPLAELGLNVIEITRGSEKFPPQPETTLEEGDLLIVTASRQSLLKVKERTEIQIREDTKVEPQDLRDPNLKIVEAVIMPHSVLVGRSLRELSFRQRFGASVLAIYRRGQALATRIADLPLMVGDVVLLQAPARQLESLVGTRDLLVLEEMEHYPLKKRKGLYALLALTAAVVLASLKLLPLAIAFLLAALAVVLFRCLTVEEVYDAIDWRLIILIGGMTSFGLAMQKTGAGEYLAALVVHWTAPWGIYPLLGGFAALTMLLTQPMSNAAAALIVLPVALPTAALMDLNPRTFAILVTLSASLSFITPFEPSSILVYAPGKYQFRDFIKVGLPLTVLTLSLLVLLVPLFWPLR